VTNPCRKKAENKDKRQPTDDQGYLIKDETPPEYFTGYWQTPNIVDMLGLTPHEFRLYQHYRRICGEGGTCWQGVREIANTCKMEKKSVIAVKRNLVSAGLIRVEATIRETHGVKHRAELVTLVDIWRLNYEFCVNKTQNVGVNGVTTVGVNGVTKEYPLVKNTPINNNNNGLTEIFDFISNNFPQKLTPHITDKVKQLFEIYPPGWLLEALKTAVEAGKATVGYTEAILKDWQRRGFKAEKPQPERHLTNYPGGKKPFPKIPKRWPGQEDEPGVLRSAATGKVIGYGRV